jgi:SAM-dependent methyltransferase
MPYQHLALYYDALMRNVDYGAYANFLLKHAGSPVRVLDLACGTGRLAQELTERGCDVVATDGSPEMLTVAQGRGCGALFLLQKMSELDLFGTVEAAFCTFDALNYLNCEKEFRRTLERVRLFVEPGGSFIFDIITSQALAARNGSVFYSDAEDVYCNWRCTWKNPFCRQEIVLFAKTEGNLWERFDEIHTERAFESAFVEESLREAGFATVLKLHPPFGGDDRVVYMAK